MRRLSAGFRQGMLHLMGEALAPAVLAASLGAFPTVWSQEVTAALTGTILDPTGASIAGAKVSAKDTERGTVYAVQSNGIGVFHLPRIPVGTYDLTVEAPGFQTAVYHDDAGAEPDRPPRFPAQGGASR